jgi:dihydrodipicolinate synthase/N-acetylneuraminate lyase
MLLEGMFLPLTTPFAPDGRLHTSKLNDNVTRYSKTPAAGLVALARSGQATLLTDRETREAMRAVAAAAVAEKVLVTGVARDSVAATLELIEYAAELGYDAALVPVPTTLRVGENSRQILSYYRAVADAAALPVILDSGTRGEGEIALESVAELAQHPGIIAIVDMAGGASRTTEVLRRTASVRCEVTVTMVFAAVTARMLAKNQPAESLLVSAGALSGGGAALSVAPSAAKPALKTRSKAVGFQVLCGRTAAMLDALEAGAVGAMPPLAASAPQVCYEVLAAWKDGDPALAAEKQERLRAVALKVEEEMGVSGIKYGCDLNGYFGGRPRLPMLPLTGTEREEIDALMQGIRN